MTQKELFLKQAQKLYYYSRSKLLKSERDNNDDTGESCIVDRGKISVL